MPDEYSPQDHGMMVAMLWLRDHGFDWALHIDSDEFLLIETGTGKISDLMPHVDKADVVPISWRLFGDSNISEWIPGDNVLQRFTHAEPGPRPGETKSKCLFRLNSFGAATDHNPLFPLVDDPVVMNADGERLSNKTLYSKRSSRFHPADIACRAKNARLNHYATRAQDSFLMKNERGDGQGKAGQSKYFLGSRWHQIANRNDTKETAILARWPKTEARLNAMRDDTQVSQAEKNCRDWFIARRAALLTPERRQLWSRGEFGKTRNSHVSSAGEIVPSANKGK